MRLSLRGKCAPRCILDAPWNQGIPVFKSRLCYLLPSRSALSSCLLFVSPPLQPRPPPAAHAVDLASVSERTRARRLHVDVLPATERYRAWSSESITPSFRSTVHLKGCHSNRQLASFYDVIVPRAFSDGQRYAPVEGKCTSDSVHRCPFNQRRRSIKWGR